MGDLLKLLDGSVDDVKSGIAGKSHADLQKLRAAEQDGKTRRGVLDALDAAITATAATASDTSLSPTVASAAENSPPANIPPATTFAPSGAPEQVVPDVDPSHPAVDADPREDTTILSNRIDFNDPTISGAEAVERNLKDQASA